MLLLSNKDIGLSNSTRTHTFRVPRIVTSVKDAYGKLKFQVYKTYCLFKRMLFIGFWGGVGLGLFFFGSTLIALQTVSWQETGVWNERMLYNIVDTNLQKIASGETQQNLLLLKFTKWFYEPQRFHILHGSLVNLLMWPYLHFVFVLAGGLFVVQNIVGFKKIKEKHNNALISYYLYNAHQLYEASTALLHAHRHSAQGTGTLHNGATYCVNVTLKHKEPTNAVLKFHVKLTNTDITTVFRDDIDVSIPRKAFFKRFRLCRPFESHGVDFPEMCIVIAPISRSIVVVFVGPKYYTPH